MICCHGRMGQRWRGEHRGRSTALIMSLFLLVACSASGSPSERLTAPASQTSWRMGWRSEIVFGDVNRAPVTCRLAARLAAAGSAIRAEFASPIGKRGYRLIAAGLARATRPGSLTEVAGSQHPLTFSGASAAQVAAGGRLLSDPVRMAVRPGDIITVTLTVGPGDVPLKFTPTEPYSCARGAVPLTSPASAFARPENQAYVRTVLVDGSAQRSIVAFGDSLTENSQFAPVASYLRWTDVLVARGIDAVNAGVSGGELTGLGIYGRFTGLQRLQQMLSEPGITDIVLCLGTNDLANAVPVTTLLQAYGDAATLVRRYGARIWITTIPPRADAQWSSAYEIERQRLNTKLRSGFLAEIGARLVDLDQALRDPLRPNRLEPVDDVGDHLHLSPAGERKFAATVAAALGR
jgi:lysophospholipase L1-like esterase